MKKRLGLIINPVAGIGGRVGLKGSDGEGILKTALAMGAVPESPRRTAQALEEVVQIADNIEIVTWAGSMGEDIARSCGFTPQVLDNQNSAYDPAHTTPMDTELAAKSLVQAGVDLILFAGGDGTARNIYHALNEFSDKIIPCLGIPAGVKIHSAVYANTPVNAGKLAREYLSNGLGELKEVEVMDIDEEAFRNNQLTAKLYGYLTVPFERNYTQCAKAGRRHNEAYNSEEIASTVINNLQDDCLYLIGSGTTTRTVMNLLALPNTLLGVDAVFRKQLVSADVNEQKILALLEEYPKAKIVVSVIGGQGHVFGRGNQQFSPPILSRIGKSNITVLANPEKLIALQGRPLLVDTGDVELDQELSGYLRVVTGHNKYVMCKVGR